MSALTNIFLRELRRFDSLAQVSSLLGWDEQVNLPTSKASSSQRANQCATIAELRHREITKPDFYEMLKRLEDETETSNQDWQVILREVRRDLDRAVKIPAEFVARKVAHASDAYHVWKAAREQNDFPA